jgi:subtilisin-like proprotein convertase family protein
MTYLKNVLLMVTALWCAAVPSAHAAPYSYQGTGGAIPDGSATATSGAPLITSITVGPQAMGVITGVDISFAGLAHTWVGDLTMVLTGPGGSSLDILSRPGRGDSSTFGFGGDFLADNTYAFADSGAALFHAAPPSQIAGGVYRPSSNPNAPGVNTNAYAYTPTSFSDAFGGLSAQGLWTLEVRDWSGGDVGRFDSWTLNIHTAPEMDTFAMAASYIVPEPTTCALFAVGVAGLTMGRRRRS